MSHTFTAAFFHVVFRTHDGGAPISADFRDRMFEYIGGILRAEKGFLLAAGGAPDHVHLLISLPPPIPLADIVRIVKAKTSKWIHETFPMHAAFAWQEGYGAFSVSTSGLPRVKEYIAGQEAHHRRVTFREELAAILKKHGIAFDEKYL
jgi:REP element-mobilizing transposase RayT